MSKKCVHCKGKGLKDHLTLCGECAGSGVYIDESVDNATFDYSVSSEESGKLHKDRLKRIAEIRKKSSFFERFKRGKTS